MSKSKYLILLSALFLTACEQKQLAVTLLRDVSLSAQDNTEFAKQNVESCHGVADATDTGDRFAFVKVNGEKNSIPTSATKIADSDIDVRSKCSEETATMEQKDPFVCSRLSDTSDSLKNLPSSFTPLTVIAVEADEMEEFCADKFKNLASETQKRNGKLIFVGLTNNGNTNFGFNVVQTLKEFSNIVYCDTRVCVKNAIEEARKG